MIITPSRSANFNPRSREGSDPGLVQRVVPQPISIHAPVKGATLWIMVVQNRGTISIHAPVKGATSRSRHLQPSPRFQSTLP